MGFADKKPVKKLKATRIINLTKVPVSIYDDFGEVVTFPPSNNPSLYLANESRIEPELIYIVDGKLISEAGQIGRSTENFVIARDFGIGRDDTSISRLYDLNDVGIDVCLHESLLSVH